jgi:hypothetical protein
MATIDIFRGKIERMDNFNQFHMWVTRISLTLPSGLDMARSWSKNM